MANFSWFSSVLIVFFVLSRPLVSLTN